MAARQMDIPTELVDAVKTLVRYYEKAVQMRQLIHSPVAWAMYKAWKEVDNGKQE